MIPGQAVFHTEKGGGGESLTALAVTSSPAVGAGLSVTCVSGIIVTLSSLSSVVDLARLVVGIFAGCRL